MPEPPFAADAAAAEPDFRAPCWRCGLAVPDDAASCPHCAAGLSSSRSVHAAASSKVAISSDWFNLLFGTYGVLLVIGLVHAYALGVFHEPRHGVGRRDREAIFTQILIDTVIIAGAVIASWGKLPKPTPGQQTRIAAWVFALPVLGALLLLNLGYHALLRNILHVPLISDELTAQFDLLSFIAICVQPAIVEELYCRMFALDCLRGALGTHAAVWISAAMFGFLHVAVLPSVPYLIIAGAVFAYMRLASGIILLPMLLHFVHNLVILLLECRGH
jgi:uncharacterized protein